MNNFIQSLVFWFCKINYTMQVSESFSYSPRSENTYREKDQMTMYVFGQKEGLGSKSTYDMDTTTECNFQVSQPKWKQYNPVDFDKLSPRINKYCPFCGKYVQGNSGCFLWESSFVQGSFMCHEDCKDDDANFTLYKNQGTILQSKILPPITPFSLGSQQYLVSLTLSHPLSTIKYFTTEKKINFNGKNLYIPFPDDSDMFQPNLIILPIQQFKINLKITPIGENQPTVLSSFSLNLQQYQHDNLVIQVHQQNLTFQAHFTKLISKQQKQEALQSLNFKFPHNTSSPLIQFHACTVRLNQWKEENSPEFNPILEKEQEDSISHSKTEETSLRQFMQYLSYLKTHSGSKEFQKKVSTMTHEQIDCIVKNLLPFLKDIIVHEYGNYMFQSLVGVCNSKQRVKILSTIQNDLDWIVCQQQGTFVFQQFISFITDEEEFEIICQKVLEDFVKLSLDNYANHFLRKLVGNIGEGLLCRVGEKVVQNFALLCNNKNSVCVLKSVLRAMKGSKSLEVVNSIKKLLNCLILNIQELVTGEFGNYLIQQSYELFELSQLSSITDSLIKLFPALSCEKYSSNVILNGVRKYWCSSQKIFWSLKNSLNSKKIVAMYKNREGNKVLIELMEHCPCFPLREKILSALSQEKPSKFNQNRWLQIWGNRSAGSMQTNSTSFSDAVKYTKKYNYNNSMY